MCHASYSKWQDLGRVDQVAASCVCLLITACRPQTQTDLSSFRAQRHFSRTRCVLLQRKSCSLCLPRITPTKRRSPSLVLHEKKSVSSVHQNTCLLSDERVARHTCRSTRSDTHKYIHTCSRSGLNSHVSKHMLTCQQSSSSLPLLRFSACYLHLW